MSRSVRIGGYHQIAEPEIVETLGERTRSKIRVLIVLVNSRCEVSIKRIAVRLCQWRKTIPAWHHDNL
jgi:hypothetical protein